MAEGSVASLDEWVYLSRYSQPIFGLTTRNGGTIVDADGDDVTATLLDSEGNVFGGFLNRDATKVADSTGIYEIQFTSNDSQTPGTYELHWAYETSGIEQEFAVPIEVGAVAPAYDNLNANGKGMVENVWYRFADMFDSPLGGPHLQTYFQSHFGRGRIAQLMGSALRRLNVIAQPVGRYTLDGEDGPEFQWAMWGGLLEQATYVEIIKHLIRSYVEQPDARNVSISYLDRRDYMARWQQVLQIEQADLDEMLDVFKIQHLGLGRPSVLVEGGAYGRSYFYRSGMFLNPSRPGYYIRYF